MIPLKELGLFVEIASGNFGKVYKAVYQGCLVVVKIPKEANLEDQMTEYVFLLVFFPAAAVVVAFLCGHFVSHVWIVLALSLLMCLS